MGLGRCDMGIVSYRLQYLINGMIKAGKRAQLSISHDAKIN